MNCKHIKYHFILGGLVIVVLSTLLVFSIHKRNVRTHISDSLQARCDSLEEQLHEKEDLMYFHNYILFSEDTSAYKELMVKYYGLHNLPYSIYMADHCNSSYACYNVYDEISRAFEGLDDQDLKNKALWLAISYLKKGAALKDHRCARVLAGMYIKGDMIPCDTVLGRKYLEQAENSRFVSNEYKRIEKSDRSFFLQK